MLLKYVALWNRNLSSDFDDLDDKAGLWSYFLKTLVMTTIIANPSSDIWNEENLFDAFLFCFQSLRDKISIKPLLFDIFDERFKLLEVNENENKGFYETTGEIEALDIQ